MRTTESTTNTTVAGRLEFLASRPARRVAAVVSFAVLTAISAKVALPIPGTAVPFTFQTLAMILAGALLGAQLGAASQILYLTLGVIGVPVFAGPIAGAAYLMGPTGGYLIAAPLAAWVTGRLMGSSMLRNFGALLVGLAAIYAGGLSWLAVQTQWSTAFSVGLLPFFLADMGKLAVATLVVGRLRDHTRSLFGV
ncbi:MAG: biotin transporter BioY [Gemmatimonadota bacterium]|jgi:biotin transport system substrate-specific component|nr:biotin transporter BioY [Gemmatimonadota bacterium]